MARTVAARHPRQGRTLRYVSTATVRSCRCVPVLAASSITSTSTLGLEPTRKANCRVSAILTSIACLLFTTEESIATPCPVKAMGAGRNPIRSEWEAAKCDLHLDDQGTYLTRPV